MKKLVVRYISEWMYSIEYAGKRTQFQLGMTYGSAGQPNTYQYHIQDSANKSGIACYGFIQGFGFPSESAAYKAGIDQYKKSFIK